MFTPELIADNATKVSLVGDPDLVRELRFSFERLGIVVTDADPDGSISVGVPRWSRAALLQKATRDLGLPVPRYAVASNPDELEVAAAQLGFPCVVKGDSVEVVRSPEDVQWRGKCVVENFVDFDRKISMVAVRSVDPATGELATWYCEPISEGMQPFPLGAATLDNARSVAARITNAIGCRGLFVVEMFVKGDDVYFSDVTIGPSLTGFVTCATQRFGQFDLHARALLGLPIDVTLTSPGAMSSVEVDEVPRAGLARALAMPEVNVVVGQTLAVALATADTAEQAWESARAAVSELEG
ncbi:ATP-grasp domain-containing protein [Corynebacterium rouxii]|uniref:ATP-grasp domain-containing protein n=1 Tax=Corynebacterium rouxii TaxID=2719119 RepID=A0ABU3PPR3_9CORY|nr:ATP-grasp domain-containing protein [Corynebacterium rouxii]MDT9409571.1 ATP-grasp domain-containing protein [Corynebacterium rouxii]MDT9411804.1 ATP-grasp domain-containing protein [Corynebacterium rouxii]